MTQTQSKRSGASASGSAARAVTVSNGNRTKAARMKERAKVGMETDADNAQVLDMKNLLATSRTGLVDDSQQTRYRCLVR